MSPNETYLQLLQAGGDPLDTPPQDVSKAMLGGGLGGAVIGGGLGALFAKLAGQNPAIGAIGAIPGGLLGALNGRKSANALNQRQAYLQNTYGVSNLGEASNLSPEEYYKLMHDNAIV